MREWEASIIRDAILTAAAVRRGDIHSVAVRYWRRRDTRLWQRAYDHALWPTTNLSRYMQHIEHLARALAAETALPPWRTHE